MSMVRIVLAVAAMVVVAPGTAGADPTPSQGPGYQIPGPSGPQFPGVQTYQPHCLVAPLSCGLRYDPATETWQPGTGSS
ncbi:MAG: hypothetical protein WA488_06740 [Mycobacterium sp.]|uniref:hypothetical protein n=1 Tax=Mycobacterium sp. TaxID=1785 RepID=UPI003BBBD533